METPLYDLLIERLAWARTDLREDDGDDVDRVLARIRVLNQTGDELANLIERVIDREVLRARDRGAPWSKIGRALRISRQSAQSRYLAAVARTGRLGGQTRVPRRMSDLEPPRTFDLGPVYGDGEEDPNEIEVPTAVGRREAPKELDVPRSDDGDDEDPSAPGQGRLISK